MATVASLKTTPRVDSSIGKNIQAQVQNGILTLTIDLTKRHGLSASGKTEIVATSSGNVTIEGGGGVIIGINAYVKP